MTKFNTYTLSEAVSQLKTWGKETTAKQLVQAGYHQQIDLYVPSLGWPFRWLTRDEQFDRFYVSNLVTAKRAPAPGQVPVDYAGTSRSFTFFPGSRPGTGAYVADYHLISGASESGPMSDLCPMHPDVLWWLLRKPVVNLCFATVIVQETMKVGLLTDPVKIQRQDLRLTASSLEQAGAYQRGQAVRVKTDVPMSPAIMRVAAPVSNQRLAYTIRPPAQRVSGGRVTGCKVQKRRGALASGTDSEGIYGFRSRTGVPS